MITISTKLTFAILALFILSTFNACKKEVIPDPEYNKAVVYWTGAPAVDGCGWLLLMDGVSYHPTNLAEDYQIDGLNVLLTYTNEAEDYRCGLMGTPYESIKIDEIKKRVWEVEELEETNYDQLSLDMFFIDTVYIEGDSLHWEISHSGGCGIHQYNLWKMPENETGNIELLFEHEGNGDLCEAILYAKLGFSLIPLREYGEKSVTFLLRGSPIMSAYLGEFTYTWD